MTEKNTEIWSQIKNGNFGKLIAGPCAVESYTQLEKTAAFLKEKGVQLLRAGAYKPRTSPESFQGLGREGIKIIQDICRRYSLFSVTEIMDVGEDNIPRLNVLDLQHLIRIIPKPVIAMVNGYAIGGGHVLHIVCDLTIASENAKFGQTGPKVGSFDAGYGAGYLARLVGHKKAREIWYLCRQYTAKEALEMGLVNTVVPFEQLEEETVKWAEEILQHSPMALRFLKASFNADTDGLAGLQQFAGDATLLYYTTDEAKEGRDAFKEKRKPDFKQFPKFP